MFLKVLSTALALVCAAPLHAQVSTEEVSSDPVGILNGFDGFDSSLGTLNSVRFTGTISDHRFVEVFSPEGPFSYPGNPVSVVSSGAATIHMGDGTFLASSSLFGGGRSPTSGVDTLAFGTFDMLFTSGLERFLAGSSAVPLYAAGSTNQFALDSSGTLLSIYQQPCSGGRGCSSAGLGFSGSFTFNYTPAVSVMSRMSAMSETTTVSAVPEPGSWAMMLLGFGAVGFASRRRRQVRAQHPVTC